MKILIVIDKPDLSKGIKNTQYYKLITSLPVSVEVNTFFHKKYSWFPFDDEFVIEFISTNLRDLNKAAKYFLGNYTQEILDVFKLGNKQVISI